MKKTDKKCSRCKMTFPATTEHFYSKNKQKTVLYSYCKDCYNAIIKEKHASVKRKLADLLGGQCKLCGYSKCLSALDFHHLDPKVKDFGIGQTRRSYEKMLAEVSKCILVCRNCHAEIHQNLHSDFLVQ